MNQAHAEEIEEPWDREPSFTQLLLHDNGPNGKAKFHCLDVWHCIHLGIGEAWVAGAAMELQGLLEESSIDRRLAIMSQKYKTFCKQNGLVSVINKLDKDTFGATKADRTGSWNKAAVTSNLMLFLENLCEEHAEQIQHDEVLRIIVSFLRAVQEKYESFAPMFDCSFWFHSFTTFWPHVYI